MRVIQRLRARIGLYWLLWAMAAARLSQSLCIASTGDYYMSISALFSFSAFALLMAWPMPVEAKSFQPGTRVLVTGRFQRKCSARVAAVPALGFAQLSFDRPGCGDSSQPVEMKSLQEITFVPTLKNPALSAGDSVVLAGLMGGQCSGTVKEISRSGYVSIDLDSDLCADSTSLHKAANLTRVQYVQEAAAKDKKFAIGQNVMAPGIHEQDQCAGQIEKITDNGLASIRFDALTCAYAGKLYSLSDLHLIRAAPKARARVTGDAIFNRIMREIASSKKTKKQQARR